ncbi:hypothetical protein [Lonepinella sp. BR2474]|uniref:hypothetical protein n=1 Tax=Lonepinella sp. BR2474 TaxID=3434548 RepID=UPI003F6E2231
MKNMKKFSLNLITVVLASTALAACSSSKGGDDPNTGKYLTSPPTTSAKPIDSSSSSSDESSSSNDSTTETEQSADQNTTEMELAQKEADAAAKAKAEQEAAAAAAAAEKAKIEAEKVAAEAAKAAEQAKVEAEKAAAAEKLAAEKAAADAAKAAEQAKADAEKAAAEKAKAEAEKAAAEKAKAEAEKAAAEKAKAEAEKAAAEKAKAEAEKAAAEKAKAEAEKAKADAEKAAAEEKAKEEAEKADKPRVDKNVAEVKKGFGTSQTYTDENTNNKFTYVNGTIVKVGEEFENKNFATDNKNLNELVIDGKKISLYSDDEIVAWRDQFHPEDDKNGKVGSGNNPITAKDIKEGDVAIGKVGYLPSKRNSQDFEQTRFGYIVKDGITHLFVQGIRTPEEGSTNRSPFNYSDLQSGYESAEGQQIYSVDADGKVTGVYTYKGGAFYGKDGQYIELSALGAVDFDNKNLMLELKDGEQTKLTLGAKVKGTEFDGMLNGVQTKGAFYGSSGQDIAGVFYQTQGDEKDYNGAFGASKVNCTWRGCEQLSNDLKVVEEMKAEVAKQADNVKNATSDWAKGYYQEQLDKAQSKLTHSEEIVPKLEAVKDKITE